MFIDIHAHAYRLPQQNNKNICGFCSAEQLLEEWDKLGISKGVVQPIVSPEVYFPQTNDDVLEMAEKYPDRIIPFCNVDPRMYYNSPRTDFTELLEYYKEKGCKGMGEIMPKMEILDPKLQNLFYYAQKVGFSVTLDGSPRKDYGFGVYDDPGLPQLEMTLRSFPELIVFAHGPLFWVELAKLDTVGARGYYYTEFCGHFGDMGSGPIEEGALPKLMRKYPNLYAELSDLTPGLMFMRDQEYGAKFLDEFQDRVFFGTDIVCPDMPVDMIRILNEWRDTKMISQEVYDKVTYKNAEKFLA